jgi:hypothetical protein
MHQDKRLSMHVTDLMDLKGLNYGGIVVTKLNEEFVELKMSNLTFKKSFPSSNANLSEAGTHSNANPLIGYSEGVSC